MALSGLSEMSACLSAFWGGADIGRRGCLLWSDANDLSGHWIRLVPILSSAGSKIDGGTARLSVFARRSPCQTPLCVDGAELVLLGEQGAGDACLSDH
jgi:hypothetical protein